MSFDVNPISNKPVIREAANMQNDGGAGNLGYFEREEGQQKQKEDMKESIFEREEKSDSFHHEGEEPEFTSEDFSLANIIAKIIFFFKSLVRK